MFEKLVEWFPSHPADDLEESLDDLEDSLESMYEECYIIPKDSLDEFYCEQRGHRYVKPEIRHHGPVNTQQKFCARCGDPKPINSSSNDLSGWDTNVNYEVP